MSSASPRLRKALVVALVVMLAGCAEERPGGSPTPTPRPSSPRPSPPQADSFTPVELASGLNIPVAITFAPDGRIFFAEAKSGTIRALDANGRLLPEPLAQLEVSKEGEFGLVGLALDPSFSSSRRIYAYLTEPNPDGSAKSNKVVRLKEEAGKFVQDAVIFDAIPGSRDKHVSGRMAFGPDGMLYVAVGDTQRPEAAQDPNSPVGKILRLKPDGGIPPDNPFPGSPAFAVGFRNPFGLAFDPASKKLFAVDNGPASHDELNVVTPGGNYGHPVAFGPSGGRFSDPVWHSGDDSHGMSGVAVVRASAVTSLANRVMFCSFDDGKLHSLPISPDGTVGQDEPLAEVGCNLDVAVSPEGVVYLASGSAITKLEPVFSSSPNS